MGARSGVVARLMFVNWSDEMVIGLVRPVLTGVVSVKVLGMSPP
jgi:hypothetical protein